MRPGYGRAPRRGDGRRRAPDTEPEARGRPGYGHAPKDEGGGLWERLKGIASIAPVQGNPSLDPANEPWEVATQAGWGDVRGDGTGHDAVIGVGEMATPGGPDARRELEVRSATPGGPLELGPDESAAYQDTRGAGTHDLRLDRRESGEAFDWCGGLRRQPGEGWL